MDPQPGYPAENQVLDAAVMAQLLWLNSFLSLVLVLVLLAICRSELRSIKTRAPLWAAYWAATGLLLVGLAGLVVALSVVSGEFEYLPLVLPPLLAGLCSLRAAIRYLRRG